MTRTNYQRGADFERRVRDKLYEDGAWLVMRAAGSRTPADLAAFYPSGRPWLVQCKRDGRLYAAARRDFIGLTLSVWCKPVLARADSRGRIELVDLSPDLEEAA